MGEEKKSGESSQGSSQPPMELAILAASPFTSIEENNSTAPTNGNSTPSYAASQFSTLIHRQQRRQPGMLKLPPITDKPGNRINLERFSGWGETQSLTEIGKGEEEEMEREMAEEKERLGEGVLGTWRATGVVGPAVAGSPFYAFPAVVNVASVYSPLSLLLATFILPLFQPILVSLASTIPISGATYNYPLLLSRTRHLSLIAASLTILDDAATSIVSAATAANYVLGQFHTLQGREWIIAGVIVLAVGLIGLTGLRAGAGVGMTLLVFHLIIMTTIIISSFVYWGQHGSATLASNWHQGQPGSAKGIVAAIVKGICISFLGVTGYETSPDFLSSLKPKAFPRMLTNLQVMAVCLNAPTMLVTIVVLPMEKILGNGSILNDVAEKTVGKVLSILVTIDAVGILSAGVLTGIISACAIFGRLAEDGILPRALLKTLPVTHAPAVSIVLFTALCLVIYASSGASLSIMSSMFALVFLSIMSLYPLCSTLLSYQLPRLPSTVKLPVYYSPLILVLSIALMVGNIVLSPLSLAYFTAYTAGITVVLMIVASKTALLRIMGQLCERENKGLGNEQSSLERKVKALRKEWMDEPRILFVESDEISRLMEMILFIRRNEDTTRIKLVHCYKDIEEIPKELEANHRILDEAFPSITIDLIFVQSAFTPTLVHVLTKRLNVPRSQCFMGCPSAELPYGIEEFRGVRMVAV